jgi:hypothetical protein
VQEDHDLLDLLSVPARRGDFAGAVDADAGDFQQASGLLLDDFER